MIDEAVAAHRSGRSSAPTTYLHIGTMKTGTSFVQSVLSRNHEVLAGEDVTFPGNDRWAMQVRATRDVLSIKGKPVDGAWDQLVRHIHAWPGRAALVSMEFLSLASADDAIRVVRGLAPSRVEVILTARDLVRVLPSAWQSMIKQGRPWSYPDFLASVIDPDGGPAPDAARRFWRHHDLPEIARKWVAAVGAPHVHLVSVPPSGAPPSLLWERFCSVVGLDPSRYDISQDKKSNFSLSYSDTELLRLVNRSLGDDFGGQSRKKWATRFLANRVLRAHTGDATAEDRPTLDAEQHRWAVQRSEQDLEKLHTLGLHVVGDLDELLPVPRDPDEPRTAATPQERYPDRAGEVIAALVKRLAQLDPEAPAKAHREPPRDDADADLDDEP
ncbi:MAG: hypothetical protein H0V67_09715 [Geodermatophilaceae bacterium]|nr:hypothetical protein [Geodermatophilaceae bacterium]